MVTESEMWIQIASKSRNGKTADAAVGTETEIDTETKTVTGTGIVIGTGSQNDDLVPDHVTEKAGTGIGAGTHAIGTGTETGTEKRGDEKAGPDLEHDLHPDHGPGTDIGWKKRMS